MKAAVLKSFGSALELQQLPDPRPGAGELVVDVAATRVLSYTDEVLSGARRYPLALPMAVGVGAIGRVVTVGPDATRLKPGDWVFCDPTVRARDDAESPDILLQGWIAPGEGAQRMQSHFHHGPFAQQMLLPLENAVALDGMDAAAAVRWCALSTCLVPYGGLLAAGTQPGDTVLVSGATGHFGSAGVAVALAMGAARVVAPGREARTLDDLVSRFGDRVVPVALSGDAETDSARMRQAGANRIARVVDLLPALPDASAVRAAAMAVRPGGVVVLMGGQLGDLPLPYSHLMRNGITVRGQFMYPRDAPARLARLVGAGLLSLDQFEFKTFALDDANAAVAYAKAHGGPFRLTVLQP